MTKSFFTSALFAVGAALTISGGCSSDESGAGTVCNTGDTRTCVGEGACQGGQECLPDGSGFGPCRCGGATGGAAGQGVGGATAAAGGSLAGAGGSLAGAGGNAAGGGGSFGGLDITIADEDPPCIENISVDCTDACDARLSSRAECCGNNLGFDAFEYGEVAEVVRLQPGPEWGCQLCDVVNHIAFAVAAGHEYRVSWLPGDPRATGWFLTALPGTLSPSEWFEEREAGLCAGPPAKTCIYVPPEHWLVAFTPFQNATAAYLERVPVGTCPTEP